MPLKSMALLFYSPDETKREIAREVWAVVAPGQPYAAFEEVADAVLYGQSGRFSLLLIDPADINGSSTLTLAMRRYPGSIRLLTLDGKVLSKQQEHCDQPAPGDTHGKNIDPVLIALIELAGDALDYQLGLKRIRRSVNHALNSGASEAQINAALHKVGEMIQRRLDQCRCLLFEELATKSPRQPVMN